MKPERISLSQMQRELASISHLLAPGSFQPGCQAVFVNLQDGVSLLASITWSTEGGEIRGELGERVAETDRRILLSFVFEPGAGRGNDLQGRLTAEDEISPVPIESPMDVLKSFALRVEGLVPRIERSPDHARSQGVIAQASV